MATLALVDATTWVHGYDFTTDLNEIALDVSVESLDGTTYGQGWRVRKGGLRSVEGTLNGFWQSAASGAVDPEAFPDLGSAGRVVTMSPDGAEESVAYMFEAGKFSYGLGAAVGELLPFTLGVQGTSGEGLVRGRVMKAKGNVSSTGAIGTAQQLGAVGSDQYLYAALHVFSAGTTITIQVQSDDNDDFTSATTRGTFSTVTTTGGVWLARVAGAITDDWWRLNVSACTGTFSLACAVGIQ